MISLAISACVPGPFGFLLGCAGLFARFGISLPPSEGISSLRIFVKLATSVTQNSSLSGIVRLDPRNLASFVVLVQETAAGVIVTTRDCFEEMTKSIPHNLNKHQAISLIWVIYKNGEDSGHLWTAHRGKRMVKDMVPEFAVTERKAACTVALESTNRAYWEKDELTSILNRGVKFDYYFGSPGWLSITTHETALGPVKKDTIELAGHFRDLLTLKAPRVLPKGMDFAPCSPFRRPMSFRSVPGTTTPPVRLHQLHLPLWGRILRLSTVLCPRRKTRRSGSSWIGSTRGWRDSRCGVTWFSSWRTGTTWRCQPR
jgi:hypothetical protein